MSGFSLARKSSRLVISIPTVNRITFGFRAVDRVILVFGIQTFLTFYDLMVDHKNN